MRGGSGQLPRIGNVENCECSLDLGRHMEGGGVSASTIGRTLNSRDACDVRPVILTERR